MAEGVILLHTIHDLFTLQRELERRDLEVKAIPTPRHLSSDCGTALRFGWADLEEVRRALAGLDLEVQGTHEL